MLDHAISYIRRRVSNTEEKVPSEVLDRLNELWCSRRQYWEGDTHARDELFGFGWWFSSTKFDDKWFISELEKTLDLTNGIIELDFKVAKRLKELTSTYPLEVVKCLKMMVKSPDEWIVQRLRKDITEILKAIHKCDEKPVQTEAQKILNYLGDLGYHEIVEEVMN